MSEQTLTLDELASMRQTLAENHDQYQKWLAARAEESRSQIFWGIIHPENMPEEKRKAIGEYVQRHMKVLADRVALMNLFWGAETEKGQSK